MNFDASVTIAAPAERVWEVFTDVEKWPDWTASVSEVRVVEGKGVHPGARVRIKQPRFPSVTWEVTEVEPGRAWTWVARSPGVTTRAVHRITPTPAGALVEQRIEQDGPLGGVLGRLTRGITDRYLAMEGAGLKARCEAAAG